MPACSEGYCSPEARYITWKRELLLSLNLGYICPLPLSFIDLFYTQARLWTIFTPLPHTSQALHIKRKGQEALGKRESEINEMPCGSRLPQGISFLFAGRQLADRLIVRFALTCRVA